MSRIEEPWKLQVQIFRIIGTYKSKRGPVEFNKEFRALREEDAIEQLYAEVGSKHRIKRNLISVKSVEKVTSNQITNQFILRLSMSDDVKIRKE